jgi:hypothetical protein
MCDILNIASRMALFTYFVEACHEKCGVCFSSHFDLQYGVCVFLEAPSVRMLHTIFGLYYQKHSSDRPSYTDSRSVCCVY